jgi:DNA-binding NarL/FixJ family response regulator
MKKILYYKGIFQEDQKMDHLKLHFANDVFCEVEDFSEISLEKSNQEIPLLLITLGQIRKLDKKLFRSMLDRVEKMQIISIIQPDQVGLLSRLLKSGMKSVLFHQDPLKMIITCIDDTREYGGYISPNIVARINKQNKLLVDIQYKITATQNTILKELMMGKSDKMIATSLDLSYHTIKTHRKALYNLFHVNSQCELFAFLNL